MNTQKITDSGYWGVVVWGIKCAQKAAKVTGAPFPKVNDGYAEIP